MFPKDLLIVDIETSGSDPYAHVPIEIGAVLLDKDTLAEKKSFTSYIHQDDHFPVEQWALKKVKIDYTAIAAAPRIEEVTEKFTKLFGFDVTFAAWVVAFDVAFFSQMLKSIGLQWGREYSHHALDLFTLTWMHLAKNGWKTIPDSETVFQHFGLPPRGFHTALEDCRLEAEVLRKICNAKLSTRLEQ